MVQPVPENINFPKEEETILELWKKLNAFETCLKQSKGKPRFTFYDGPPFATGLPHFGHILAGTIKDVVTRYAHQSGFHVERRFGWDCHGLPVEYEIDKMLNIKGPDDVAKMGIAEYNSQCRKIVMRYSSDWETIIGRLGRWIDFKNDYKTMYPWFMESVWWIFKQLFDKGLVYRGSKVMPYSTTCNTPLSNFETGQNYKEVVDPAVIVSFPLDESPDISLIAWTTTPWTLPSNLSLCVNANMDYVQVKDEIVDFACLFPDKSNDKIYILMEARIESLYKKSDEYIVLKRFKGSALKGKSYEPIFPYFKQLKKERHAFQVLCDNYVTEDSGTGVVHNAPYFGEDDFRICLLNGIITKDMDMICPVDSSGCFMEPVSDFVGQYVKDADKNIMKVLKNNGRLVNQSTVKHNYPFCWRSETPLIYKAVPSWFIRVEQMQDILLKNNQKTYWVPEFVKEKRFANWLSDARDWAVSRNRYWGTPIPIWISEDDQEIVCVGSIEELENLTGTKVEDLHRETVDKLTIPSKTGRGVLRRISEVFDCWFESGSMPYAQAHYPFENRKEFDECFPANFIAEGIDQTRGWFYTLLVISTALFNKPPFKNLIVNGLVLAGDGQKMSKRKKNYPDPMLVVNNYGADALRLYLINSPVVRAENLRFKEEGVRSVLKDVFLPWYNAYRFLVQNIERLERLCSFFAEKKKHEVQDDGARDNSVEGNEKFTYNEEIVLNIENIMDKWILSFVESMIQFLKTEMAAYRLYTVVPRLVKFIDNLTNWYVRSNRKRLKGDDGQKTCIEALQTLFSVLFSMIKVMSPFTPFLTEHMYQNLRHLVSDQKSNEESVHYLMMPVVRSSLIDFKIENSVSHMQSVIELGRVIRDRKTLPIKYPLPEVVVIHQDSNVLKEIRSLEKYILEELNVKCLTTTTDKTKYGVRLRAEPDYKGLGARLKGAFKGVTQEIKELSDEKLQDFQKSGKMTIQGHELLSQDVRLIFTFGGEEAAKLESTYEAHSDNNVLVLLNITPDQAMLDEGVAREVINRIQKLRKKAHLVPSDEVTAFYSVEPKNQYLEKVVLSHTKYIENTLKAQLLPLPHPSNAQIIIQDSQKLKDSEVTFVVVQRDISASQPKQMKIEESNTSIPHCKFVNVELCTGMKQQEVNGNKGTILLENPQGIHEINYNRLVHEVKVIFGLEGTNKNIEIFFDKSKKTKLTSSYDNMICNINKQTLYVFFT
ncbi:Isoleucine--tRNA ligase, cytoplasmic [Nymphon striatum]|nr:Isoleucine--tRNA ligase, cytoplasmic [Nymphon striatum]